MTDVLLQIWKYEREFANVGQKEEKSLPIWVLGRLGQCVFDKDINGWIKVYRIVLLTGNQLCEGRAQ